MSINQDEALRAKDLAEESMKKTDFTTARKLAAKAQKMDCSLENISRMIMVCDVHCAATEKLFGNEMDWYGILQIEPNADDIIIKKQYKRLALLLHPDKNKLPGAESAFKLIGEAQRMLLDKEKRKLHDIKRKSWRKPAPAPPYKTQRMPSYQTQPVFQASANMRNIFTELKPENRYPYQKAQAQPAVFSHRTTFWTTCAFCQGRYEYHREHINKEITCQFCRKQFTAFENSFQSAPPTKGSCQTTSFPQQNKYPGQKACSELPKHPEIPATVFSRKASIPIPGSTAKNNGKRKRKNLIECSESSDSESSSEEEDVVIGNTVASRDFGSSGLKQSRRSVRSKQQVSYNEMSDDDDLVNNKGEGSGKNIDTEREEEPEEENQTNGDHSSTENIVTKEKLKEDQVETSVGVSDPEEDLSSGSAAKINLINYDFNNFDTLTEKSCFQAGQIWALYDDEQLPRYYALIRKVATTDFMLKYVWLEVDEDEDKDNETPNVPVSVGKFELGGIEQTNNCNIFSHLVQSTTKSKARKFKVFPRKGETWALFKNWDVNLSAELGSPLEYEYEFAEILSDHVEGDTISVGFLSKVKGFSCVFCPMPKEESNTCEIPPHEFCRFSHRIPSFRLKGTEGRGVAEGWYELDPAALPVSVYQNLSGEEAAQDQDHQSPPSGSAL